MLLPNATHKVFKRCRQCLPWIQYLVFEGEISPVKLKELKLEASKIIDLDYDSFIIFESRTTHWLQEEIIGKERGPTDQFL